MPEESQPKECRPKECRPKELRPKELRPKELRPKQAQDFQPEPVSAKELIFGYGSIGRLEDVARRLRAQRVLLVTDENLLRAGLVDQVLSPLLAAGVQTTVFDRGQPEPQISVAEAAIELARQVQPQAIVGLGGGSNLDVAKLTAVVATHGGTPRDYFGENRVPGPVLPVVCIPTTSGTGSEVSHAAVVTDPSQNNKVSTLSPYLRPAVALVDPLLTLSCPPKATADSGIDALVHAIEAYTAAPRQEFLTRTPAGESPAYHGSIPRTDAYAQWAIRLIGKNLVTAVRDGQCTAARGGMALGATFAGIAFSNAGVALVHALEYPLGAATHCSHGEGNGLLLPHVMRFNLSACPQRFSHIASWLGKDTQKLSEPEAAEAAISAIEQLQQEIGIPQRLRDLGAKADDLPRLAAQAYGIKRLMRLNARLPTEADLLEILQAAF